MNLYYSESLQDAINLAVVAMEEGPRNIIHNADFHMCDIAQYDASHPAIAALKTLKSIAQEYAYKTTELMVEMEGYLK